MNDRFTHIIHHLFSVHTLSSHFIRLNVSVLITSTTYQTVQYDSTSIGIASTLTASKHRSSIVVQLDQLVASSPHLSIFIYNNITEGILCHRSIVTRHLHKSVSSICLYILYIIFFIHTWYTSSSSFLYINIPTIQHVPTYLPTYHKQRKHITIKKT